MSESNQSNLTTVEVTALISACLRRKTNDLPFQVGKCYLLRTVTNYQVGRVHEIVGKHIVMKDGAWVVDTGRFHDCLKSGEFKEVEPFVSTFGINSESIVDWAEWDHDLPQHQK